GVSRTSKTPTSIYLANRGVKTANFPLVPGMPVPEKLETLAQPLVVGLTASPERIVQIRQNRLLGLRAEHDADQYIDRQAVAAEIAAARKKARAVAGQHPGRMVIGADQTLALGERRFSKAADRAGAREQIAALRGKTHMLYSAVAVVAAGTVIFEYVDAAQLTMRAFSD